MMLKDLSTEYSHRSDDELLQLVSERNSLTTEAAAALNAELRRRGLTDSDVAEHQRFAKRQEHREARKQRRKIFGTKNSRDNWVDKWVDMFWALFAIALISIIYLALPSRYHLKPDWQEAAVDMMFASVFIAVAGRFWWRKMALWTSLAVSSAIHLVVVHAWIQRAPNPSRSQGQLAVLLGFLLFVAVYGLISLLRRNFYGKEPLDDN